MAFDLRKYYGPIGPPVDWFTQDISTEDFVDEEGFAAIVGTDGTLSYRTFRGKGDQSKAVKAGEWLFPRPDFPGLLQAVRADSTVGSIIVVKFA